MIIFSLCQHNCYELCSIYGVKTELLDLQKSVGV